MKEIYQEMKKNEKYLPLETDNISFNGANYITVSENEGDVSFLVDRDEKNVVVKFEGITPFYSYSEQSARSMTFAFVQQQNNDRSYFKNDLIYVVENSVLSKLFEIETYGFYSDIQLKHYCIVTDQDVVDVLSTSEPLIYEKD